MRILGVDRGDVRIGIAVSDETGMIANPVGVIQHVSLSANAAEINRMARELGAEIIVIGVAMDSDNVPSPSGRKSIRLGEAIVQFSGARVDYVDEYGSTKMAQSAGIAMGLKRSLRGGHRDAIAASIILQTYLDTISGGNG